MKKVLLVVLTFMLMISVNAKEPELLWEKTWNYGDDYISMFSDTATNSKGNHYAAGSYSDVYGGKVRSNYIYLNGILNKYDKDGSIIWERKYEDDESSVVFLSVETLSDDGCVVLGLYNYENFFAESLSLSSKDVSNSIFSSKFGSNEAILSDSYFDELVLIRYDKNGDIVWERTINAKPGYDNFSNTILYSKVSVTNDDNIYVFVNSKDSTLFKYDKNGTKVWSSELYKYSEDENSGTITYEYPADAKMDNDGNYIIVGTSRVDVESGSGDDSTSISTYEGTITKKDKDNKTIFSKKYKLDNKNTEFISVAPLNDGNYLLYVINEIEKTNIKFSLIIIDKDGNKISQREIKNKKINNGNMDSYFELMGELYSKIYVDKQGNYIFVDYELDPRYKNGEGYASLYYDIRVKSIKTYDKDMNLLWTRNTDSSKELLVKFNINDYNDYLIVGSNFREYETPPKSLENSFSQSLNANRIQDSALIMKYSTDYKIDKEVEGKGSIDVSLVNAKAGDEITIDAKAEDGYRIEKIIVTDKDGNIIKVSGNKFVMPNSDVTVKVIFTDSPLVNPKTGAISITFAVIAISVYAFFQYKYIKTKEMSL